MDDPAPVVVATDDGAMRQLLVRVLGDAGYAVEPVADGEGMLHRLRAATSPCVALLSLRRSRLDSRAVLEAVAADGALARGHGYVLLTALWDALPRDLGALLQELAVAVVPKPFDLDALLDAVAQMAGRLARG
jgi:CheY-like chemotaxis protein